MSKSKNSILIIDDELGWVDFSRSILKAAGYAVEIAENAMEAWDFLTKRAFDLILMDLKQAEKGDILQKIAKSSPHERRRVVVLFPTYLSPSKMRGVFKSGAYDCEDKPFDKSGLIRMVKEKLTELAR